LPAADEPSPSHDDDEPFTSSVSASHEILIAGLVAALARVERANRVRPPLSASESEERVTALTSFAPALLAAWREALLVDSTTSKILEHPKAHPAFSVIDGLVFLDGPAGWQLVVPAGRVTLDGELETTFVELACEHAHRTAGHLGAEKTLALARHNFWWRTMVVDVADYVKQCEPCRRGKSTTMKPLGLLHALAEPSAPFERIGVDFMVGLPPVPHHGRVVDSIMTVTDYLSKLVLTFALPSTSTAADVADLFVTGVYRRFGLPSSIVSDRDPKFTSAFWRALNARLGIKLRMSTAAHPETDGRAEVTNKSVGQTLRVLAEDNPDEW
ncbi:hypothetical protein JCM3770_006366, partial [Rhodotorula araucariae]